MSKSVAAAQQGASTAGDPYVPLHGNGGYRVEHYDLELTYRVATNQLVGRARISARSTQRLRRFSLDLAGLRVGKVKVDGASAAFGQPGRKLHITPSSPLPEGTAFEVLVDYAGAPAPLNGRWGGLGWDELTDGVLVASQPNGAPTWFPCNDHPSNKASYRIAVTTESAYQVISNGTLIRRRRAASQTTWVYEQPEPMATYLATVQIGRYEILDLADGLLPVRAAVPGKRRALFRADFRRQQEMLELFGRLFGPYPFAGYTVVLTDDPLEIPVEAQGISVFGSNFLDGRRGQERLVAHELAHQWFGNSLTLDSWQHIWLHEGFACYAEWLWAENSGGLTATASAGVARSALKLRPQDLLIGDPGPARMFDSRVYLRGALTVHAVRRDLGDPAFFALLREWVAGHRHGSVTTEDFLALVGRRGGDVGELRRWLFQGPLPR